jgi:hypothetical protein
VLTIHRQIYLQVRICRLFHDRLLDLLLPHDVLWIEFLYQLPLICILILRLQHFHIWCEFAALLTDGCHVLFFG